MALVFRWYLGLSSRWANSGESDRQADFQVWCGPAMGAFNEWVRGSALEKPENRRVAAVARNLLHGAAVVTRLGFLRAQGVGVPETMSDGGLDGGNVMAVKDLLEAIENDRQPECSVYEGRTTIEMISAVFESHRVRGPITFPLQTRENPLSLL